MRLSPYAHTFLLLLLAVHGARADCFHCTARVVYGFNGTQGPPGPPGPPGPVGAISGPLFGVTLIAPNITGAVRGITTSIAILTLTGSPFVTGALSVRALHPGSIAHAPNGLLCTLAQTASVVTVTNSAACPYAAFAVGMILLWPSGDASIVLVVAGSFRLTVDTTATYVSTANVRVSVARTAAMNKQTLFAPTLLATTLTATGVVTADSFVSTGKVKCRSFASAGATIDDTLSLPSGKVHMGSSHCNRKIVLYDNTAADGEFGFNGLGQQAGRLQLQLMNAGNRVSIMAGGGDTNAEVASVSGTGRVSARSLVIGAPAARSGVCIGSQTGFVITFAAPCTFAPGVFLSFAASRVMHSGWQGCPTGCTTFVQGFAQTVAPGSSMTIAATTTCTASQSGRVITFVGAGCTVPPGALLSFAATGVDMLYTDDACTSNCASVSVDVAQNVVAASLLTITAVHGATTGGSLFARQAVVARSLLTTPVPSWSAPTTASSGWVAVSTALRSSATSGSGVFISFATSGMTAASTITAAAGSELLRFTLTSSPFPHACAATLHAADIHAARQLADPATSMFVTCTVDGAAVVVRLVAMNGTLNNTLSIAPVAWKVSIVGY